MISSFIKYFSVKINSFIGFNELNTSSKYNDIGRNQLLYILKTPGIQREI